MITVNGIDIEFDMTSPLDMKRLNDAQKKAAEKESLLPVPPDDSSADDYLDKYCDWLNGLLLVFGNFIDDSFGDGVAEKLMTNNPSLTKMFDTNDALEEALGAHVKMVTAKFNKYKPNRATRRAK